jgi:cobalt transporter subunit CbtA
MLNRILFACLVAGILAGLAASVTQHFTTTPLILEAEVYEQDVANQTRDSSNKDGAEQALLIPASSHAHASDSAEQEEWVPGDGLERTFYSSISTIVTAFGFALMLLSAMILGRAVINVRTGLAWAAAAFVAVGLAPGLGLNPELPGSAAADLGARQIWWIGTAMATAAGIWLCLRVSSALAIASGIVLIVLPHIIGAPQPQELASKVPSELAGHFASASLAVQAVIWAIVGTIAGYVWQRTGQRVPD